MALPRFGCSYCKNHQTYYLTAFGEFNLPFHIFGPPNCALTGKEMLPLSSEFSGEKSKHQTAPSKQKHLNKD